ncbi:MAG TPA: pyrroline-5-carboxylate reductase [Steroidobacteraceae bacterium]|nr:pyrroline-5-carboxylate reductase [Steroidobacteraceae bacterium]
MNDYNPGSMNDTRIAILGAGNMGRALLAGLLRSGTRPEQLSVGEPSPAAREHLARELGVTASADNAAAVEGAAVVVLAVKPQEAQAVLGGLADRWGTQRPLLVSVAAGLRVAQLAAWCGAGVAVVRAMPNRPALVGAAATGMFAPREVAAPQRAVAEQVLSSVGEVIWVPSEDALDVVTALSGSGPAYFFLLAQLMAEAAERLGLEGSAARRLATATLYGAGLLANSGDGDLARLRAEVTSAGGTTDAALRVLEAATLRATVARALEAATLRARELAATQPT